MVDILSLMVVFIKDHLKKICQMVMVNFIGQMESSIQVNGKMVINKV
jgi:hypothetical protein